MKIRLNKNTLAALPAAVRPIVRMWIARYSKAFISVESAPSFCAEENARVTLVNLESEKSASAQVSGDFAGMTRLSPTAQIPLAPNVVAVEEGFFCGTPFLTIWQWSPTRLRA